MKILLLASLLAVCACASGAAIVTGDTRPPVDPATVQLYSTPPGVYEVIGIVKASSQMGMTEEASREYALAELKAQAAALGANGILLETVAEQTTVAEFGTFVADKTGPGSFVAEAESAQIVSGTAIYVTHA